MGLVMNDHISWKEATELAVELDKDIFPTIPPEKPVSIYGVPRGGIFAALILSNLRNYYTMEERPEKADMFIDDIIDSGKTKKKYTETYNKPFYALYDKKKMKSEGIWISFVWERMCGESFGVEDNIVRLLQYVRGTTGFTQGWEFRVLADILQARENLKW